MNPIRMVWDLLSEATKNVAKVPGWVPLAVACYVGISWLAQQSQNSQFVAANKEVLALGATALLYALGDALDTLIFKRLTHRRLEASRVPVRRSLGLHEDGYYSVAKALAVAANRYDGTSIQLANESAKFLRSVLFLSLTAAIVLLVNGGMGLGAFLLVATLGLFWLYLWLKQVHMRALYRVVSQELVSDNRFSLHDLPNRARLFFWSGQLVASGLRNAGPSHDA